MTSAMGNKCWILAYTKKVGNRLFCNIRNLLYKRSHKTYMALSFHNKNTL